MVVLLIGGIPDPLMDPVHFAGAEKELIARATYALVAVVGAAEGTLVMKRADVTVSPEFAAHLRAHLPEERVRLVDDLGSSEALAGVTHAVLVGGGERDIEALRSARDAGARVFPVGSTCAAAGRVCEREFATSALEIPLDTLIDLVFEDENYGSLFTQILSP